MTAAMTTRIEIELTVEQVAIIRAGADNADWLERLVIEALPPDPLHLDRPTYHRSTRVMEIGDRVRHPDLGLGRIEAWQVGGVGQPLGLLIRWTEPTNDFTVTRVGSINHGMIAPAEETP